MNIGLKPFHWLLTEIDQFTQPQSLAPNVLKIKFLKFPDIL